MKFSYGFSNILGAIYRNGNICFTPDGRSLISPAGNRLIMFDLKNNRTKALTLDSKYSFNAVTLSPNGALMIATNSRGEAQLISMLSFTTIHKHKFHGSVNHVKFSPDGHHFAIAQENSVFVFKSPGETTGEYNPFVLEKHYIAAYDDITWIDWSSDSRFLAIGCRDNTTKIFPIEKLLNIRTYVLGGHSEPIVGCFFENDNLNLTTVSRNGQLCMWKCSVGYSDLMPQTVHKNQDQPAKKLPKEDIEFDLNDDNKKEDICNVENSNLEKQKSFFSYEKVVRHYLADEERKINRDAHITAAAYSQLRKTIVVAFSSGSFYLYELPEVNLIHSLSISHYGISSVGFNSTGDWIALASAEKGQLLVWEWQSEQYILKQQGHNSDISCLSYSPDGQHIVTGSFDSTIKVWNTESGFCFVTFAEHRSAVSAVEFSKNKHFFVSSSLDGTVRAYDIIRYRNFRTFTSPHPVQFSCVALDYSSELVVAGGKDVFEVYLWSIKLGVLLEVLSGHEGPVTAIAFSPVPASSLLVTGSWDKTVKIWNCLENSSANETIDVLSDVTCIAFKPDGKEIAVGTLNGNITIFDVTTVQQISSIEGQRDLCGGRWDGKNFVEQKRRRERFFNSIEYTSDGSCIIAGGLSSFICIYQILEGVLLKKFEITASKCVDELKDFVDHRNLREFGNIALLEKRKSVDGKGKMKLSVDNNRGINVFSVKFSPTGQYWAAACSEGLLIFSLNAGIVFDPIDLSIEVTPKAILDSLNNNEYCRAFVLALKLNESHLIMMAIERIPADNIELICSSLTNDYVQRALSVVTQLLRKSPHIEFYLKWLCLLLSKHGNKDNVLKQNNLLGVHDVLSKKYVSLNKICNFNKYTLHVIKSYAAKTQEKIQDPVE